LLGWLRQNSLYLNHAGKVREIYQGTSMAVCVWDAEQDIEVAKAFVVGNG